MLLWCVHFALFFFLKSVLQVSSPGLKAEESFVIVPQQHSEVPNSLCQKKEDGLALFITFSLCSAHQRRRLQRLVLLKKRTGNSVEPECEAKAHLALATIAVQITVDWSLDGVSNTK